MSNLRLATISSLSTLISRTKAVSRPILPLVLGLYFSFLLLLIMMIASQAKAHESSPPFVPFMQINRYESITHSQGVLPRQQNILDGFSYNTIAIPVASALAGSQIEYQTVITNTSGSTTAPISLTASIPISTTKIGLTNSGGSLSQDNQRFTMMATLAQNQQLTTILTIIPLPPAFNGEVISYQTFLSTPTSMSSMGIIQHQVVDLQVKITPSKNSVRASELLNYTLNLTYVGTRTLNTPIIVTFDVPNNTTVQESTLPSGCSYSNRQVTCTSIDLSTTKLTDARIIQVQTDASFPYNLTTLDSKATIFDGSGPGRHSVNNSVTTAETATLQLSIDPTSLSVQPDGVINYTLRLNNTSNRDIDASGMQFTVALPAYTIWQGSPDCAGLALNGTWTATAFVIPAQSTKSCTLSVKLNPRLDAGVNNISAQAVVTYSTSPFAPPLNTPLLAPQSHTVDAAPDLQVEQLTNLVDNRAHPDQPFEYTIKVTNDGNQDATAITLEFTKPTDTDLLDGGGGSLSNGKLVWVYPSLKVGESQTVKVKVQLSPNIPPTRSIIESIANVVENPPSDPDINPSDNQSHYFVTVNDVPDITIATSTVLTQVELGHPITYLITVTNRGTADTTNVTITDILPSYVTFSSASDNGVYTNGKVVWPAINLAQGISVVRSVTIIATSTATDLPVGVETITNTVEAIDGTGRDPIANNNSASYAIGIIASPEFLVTVTDSKEVASPTEQLTYQIQVTNLGTQTSQGGTLVAQFPLNVEIQNVIPSGQRNNNTITWNLPNISVNNNEGYIVIAKVKSPLPTGTILTTTAQVKHSDDPVTSNNVATDTTTIKSGINLEVTQNDNNVTTAKLGERITYTLVMMNIGDAPAPAVTLIDILPDNTSFVSATNGYLQTGNQLIWSLNLAVNTPVTYTVVVKVKDMGLQDQDKFTNTVSITTSGDIAPENNTAIDVNTVTISNPDLVVTKSASLSTASPGMAINYVITITNQGVNTATNIQIIDTLPEGMTDINPISPGSRHSGQTVIWDLAELGVDDPKLFHVTAKAPNNALVITNTVIITANNEPSSNIANNSAVATTTIQIPLTVSIAGLLQGAVNKTQGFDLSISPVLISGPGVVYTVTATDQTPQFGQLSSQKTVSFTWNTVGTKTVTVTLADGTTQSHTINIVKGDQKTIGPNDAETRLECVVSNGGDIIVTIPANAVSEPTTFVCTVPNSTVPAQYGKFVYAKHVFELKAYRNYVELPTLTFNNGGITIAMRYDKTSDGIQEPNNLAQLYRNLSNNTWNDVTSTCNPKSTYQRTSGQLAVKVCHLTEFALFEEMIPLTQVTLSVPPTIEVNASVNLTATILPTNATTPITYTWEGVQTFNNNVAIFSSNTPGVKTITLTVTNGFTPVRASQNIEVIGTSTTPCPEQPSNSICVIDETTGQRIANAIVDMYIDGQYRGTITNGILPLTSNMGSDHNLVALRLVDTKATSKTNHLDVLTGADFAYKVYHTNLPIIGDGNIIVPTQSTLLDNKHQVKVSSKNVLVLYNILVSIEWDAHMDYIRTLENAFKAAASSLYDATNGQATFGWITIYDRSKEWAENADFQVFAKPLPSRAIVNGLTRIGGDVHIRVGSTWIDGQDNQDWDKNRGYQTFVHEFGHYAFGLYDEYFLTSLDRYGNLSESLPASCMGGTNFNDMYSLMDDEHKASEFAWPNVWLQSLECQKTEQHRRNGGSAWQTIGQYLQGDNWSVKIPDQVIVGPNILPSNLLPFPLITNNQDGLDPEKRFLVVKDPLNNSLADASVLLQESPAIFQGLTDKQGRIAIYGAVNGDTLEIRTIDGNYQGAVKIDSRINYEKIVTPGNCQPQNSLITSLQTITEETPYLSLVPDSDGSFQLRLLGVSGNNKEYKASIRSVEYNSTPNDGQLAFSNTEYRGTVIPKDGFEQGDGLIRIEPIVLNRDEVKQNNACNDFVYNTDFSYFSLYSPDEHLVRSRDNNLEVFIPQDSLEPATAERKGYVYHTILRERVLPGLKTNKLKALGDGYEVRMEPHAKLKNNYKTTLTFLLNSAITQVNTKTMSVYFWDDDNWAIQKTLFVKTGEVYMAQIQTGSLGLYAVLEVQPQRIYLPIIRK